MPRNKPAIRTLHFTTSTLLYPLLLVFVIWLFYWIELRFHINFKAYGIRPHNTMGLRGIFFSPLIHGSLSHLFSNTIPLFVLSMALFYFYKGISWQVLIIGGILTGFLTWMIGRTGTNHIGVSGIVYLMTSFLIFKGIWSKNFRLIALALIVVFLYGSLIWGMFPQKENISWEGHLSGFISGVVMALIYKDYQVEFHESQVIKRPPTKREAEFLRHFDEEGNFVPTSEWQRRAEEERYDSTLPVEITYDYKEEE